MSRTMELHSRNEDFGPEQCSYFCYFQQFHVRGVPWGSLFSLYQVELDYMGTLHVTQMCASNVRVWKLFM